MLKPDPEKIITFSPPKDLSRWLQANHSTESELWIKIFKKGTGISSVSWQDVVIETLCWGWIDGVKKSIDGEAYLQRITPRRARSSWSKKNTEHAERLIKDGRMKEPGLVHVRGETRLEILFRVRRTEGKAGMISRHSKERNGVFSSS